MNKSEFEPKFMNMYNSMEKNSGDKNSMSSDDSI